MKKSAVAFLVLFASQLVQGCVWIAKFDSSVARQQGDQWAATRQNEFVFNGTRLFVFPGNLQWKGVQGLIIPLFPFWVGFEKKPFGVLFMISPSEQTRSLYLDPQRVLLVLENGTMLAPSQLKGPFPFSNKGCKKLEDEEGKPIDQEIFIFETVCLGLFFDHEPPRPGKVFSIIIEGLHAPEKEFPVLHVSFQDSKSERNVGFGEVNLPVNP